MRKPSRPVVVEPLTARDPAGIFRLAGGIVGLIGVGSLVGALSERPGGRLRRGLSLVSAGTVAAVGIAGARDPRRAALMLLDRPRVTLAAGLGPVVLSPVFGRRFNAVHMLGIVGVGVAAAPLERRRAQLLAGVSAALWLQQAAVASGQKHWRRDERLVSTFVMVPLAFLAVAEITPSVYSAARQLAQLQQHLDRSADDGAPLERYARAIDGAFAQARSALAAAATWVDANPDHAETERIRDLARRALGRLEELSTVLHVSDETSLHALIRRTAQRALAHEASPPRFIAPEGSAEVTDVRVLALVGPLVMTAMTNVLRHAPDSTYVQVTTSVSAGLLELTIRNDGGRRAAGGSESGSGEGLAHYQSEAHVLGGDLTAGPDNEDEWVVRLEVPVSPPTALPPNWRATQVAEDVDTVLRKATQICAVMVVLMALEGKQVARGHLRRTQALALVLTGGYELLETAGLLTARRRTAALGAAAAVSSISPHHEHSLWSGWANAALARHGLHCGRLELGLLTLAHVIAIAVSHRGDSASFARMAAHEITTALSGPATVLLAAAPALRKLDARERGLIAALDAIEQRSRVGQRVHESHSALSGLEDLRGAMSDSEPRIAMEVDGAIKEISAAAGLFPEFDPTDFARRYAETLAARLYPIPVKVRVDAVGLAGLGRTELVRREFQRQLATTADELGDVLMATFPKDWLARPSISGVELSIRGLARRRTLKITALPTLQGKRPGGALEIDRLGARVAQFGGTVTEGAVDGRISMKIPLTDQPGLSSRGPDASD